MNGGGSVEQYIPLMAAVAVGTIVTVATYGAAAPATASITSALLAGSVAGSTTLAAGTAVQQGVAASQAADARKAALKRDQEIAQTQAAERGAAIREKLRRTMGAQASALASRGIDPGDFSGTPGALAQDVTNQSTMDLLNNSAWAAASRDTLQTDIAQERLASQAGLAGGIVGGVGNLAGGALNYYNVAGSPFSYKSSAGSMTGDERIAASNTAANRIFG